MRSRNLHGQVDRLNALWKAASRLNDDYVRAQLAELICVRTSGLVETALHEIYRDYATKRANPAIASFVSRRLARYQNIRPDTLLQLVGDFSEVWRTDLDSFLTDERRSALGSVIRNRNQIAHGQSVSLGLAQMRSWLDRVLEIIDFLDQQAS